MVVALASVRNNKKESGVTLAWWLFVMSCGGNIQKLHHAFELVELRVFSSTAGDLLGFGPQITLRAIRSSFINPMHRASSVFMKELPYLADCLALLSPHLYVLTDDG